MPATILRSHPWKQLTIAVNTAVTDKVNVGGMERGAIFVPSGWATADICFLASHESNDDKLAEDVQSAEPTFSLLRDETGALVKITGVVPGSWHLLPSRALVMKWLQIQSTLVGSSTGQATNQASAQSLLLAMKS